MRPASSLTVKWMSVFSILAIFTFANFSFAQTSSKKKLSKGALPQMTSHAAARTSKTPPPVTTDTWTGGGGSNTDWSDASNWNNGAITSGENIAISTTTANTIVDQSFSIGTLTLSNAGDSATVANGQTLTVGGNIVNNGTITLDSTNTYDTVSINAANVTLSGTGTLVLGGTAQYDQIEAATSGNTLINQSTITGQGTIGTDTLVISNAGTINANVSGTNLTLSPYTSTASTNSGTLEATGGGNLYLTNGTWNNTGTISAGTGSNVYLENGVTINGGTLSTAGTGWIYGASGGSTLENVTISSGSQFEVQNSATTDLVGTITNKGTITLDSTSTYVTLDVPSGTTTLTGGGTVVMGGGAQYSQIEGASGTSFVNSNNTIEGTGNIGTGTLTLTNNGTINANVSPTALNQPLYIQSFGTMTNTGTLEATNGGTLEIYSTALTNSGSGAVIQAVGADGSGNASNVVLYNSTINGGTLTTSGAGVIYGENNSELIGVTNSGNFVVPNGQGVYLSGTINNTGTMTLASSSTYSTVDLQGNTTLSGGGTVVMGAGGPYSQIVGASTSYTLTNDETIEGSGCISCSGYIGFVNNGTVNANTNGQTLTIDPASLTAANSKTMEATNGGQLELSGGTWTNTGANITAGTNSDVLLSGTTINGGTLTATASGSAIYGESNSQLNGVTLNGNFTVPNGQGTYFSGTINNSGTITLASTSTYTNFYLTANTTLSGGGTLQMGSGAQYSQIYGVSGTTLTNTNNTIEGDGCISCGGYINFTNNATVNANVSGQTLNLYLGTLAGTNTKTLEATNGGQLEIEQGTWTNTNGTITAAASSDVYLNGASITGGTLSTSGTGSSAGVILLDSDSLISNLTNSGNLRIDNGQTGELSGTITNNGTILMNSTSTYTNLYLEGNTTLSGTGTLVMGGGAQYSQLYGVDGDTLTNNGNTIEGDGCLSCNYLVFDNAKGSVIANVSGQTLAIQSTGAGTTNGGTLEATNGGTLQVIGTLTNYSSSSNTLTGGTYVANGGNVYLPLGTSGGITTLSASVTEENGGQIFNSNNSNNNALNGLTGITSTGALTIGGVAFTDSGAFSNAGSLTLLAGESFKVGSLTQISGGSLTAGSYILDSNLDITGSAQNITTNAATLTLNGGTIENTSNSTSALANLATNTGKLTLGSGIAFTTSASSFSNTGTLTLGSGSSFTAASLAQISGTTLSGGTFVLGGNLDLTTTGISITTNSSTLTLEGGTINSGSTNALAGLATNTKSLTLADDANFTTAGNFSNTGTLTVNSGSTFKVTGTLSQYHSTTNTLQGGTFVVGGNFDAALGTNGIETDSSNITLDGTGEIVNTSASNANGLVNLNMIGSTGAFTLASDANFTTAGNFSNSGKLTVNSGSTFTVTGTLSNLSSGTLTGGAYTVGGTLQLASANGGITTNAASLTLTGTAAKILDGTSNALSTFDYNTGSLTLSSAATLTTATTGSFTNAGTVDVTKGTTLTVGGTGHSYSQTAGTTTVDGTLSAGTNGTVSLTGGTIQGAGSIKGNTSNGATINVGDAGKAGLLTITGTYTQLSTATLNVSIGGATVGTQYSQLKISGTASLGGTLTAALVNSFTPTVGQTFTILTASSISGTFTNSTIAINSTEHFVVSYTATSVVLTVASGAASSNNPPQAAVAKPASKTVKPVAITTARHIGTVVDRPMLLASGKPSSPVGTVSQRIWERIPVAPSWEHIAKITSPEPVKLEAIGAPARHINNVNDGHINDGLSHALPVRTPLNTIETKRIPVKILTPTLPRMR